MKTKTMLIFQTLLFAFLFLIIIAQHAGAAVVREGNKIYLVDRTGERWDITQAVSIGFDPAKFEFGIGRYAFNPLDETNWKPGSKQSNSKMRVIGVSRNGDAHAYSVNKLWRHETANTFLGSEAIVAGY